MKRSGLETVDDKHDRGKCMAPLCDNDYTTKSEDDAGVVALCDDHAPIMPSIKAIRLAMARRKVISRGG